MGDFRDLKAWQEAKSLATLSAAAIRKLPTCERYALGDQWRRAALLHELESILELIDALDYLDREELRVLKIRRANCARLVYALLRKIDDAARRA